ncbi:RDD family protein [Bacillus sp. 2205SS5-2]|uniref:RDD family protein n=1 Tax=Bacillus sp. 2205SS5-2 TaxID=3109031 RepID=UPI003FA54001
MSDEQKFEQYGTRPLEEGLEVRDEMSMKHTSKPFNTFVYAGFWMRFWAYLIDLIVVGSLNRIVVYPFFRLLDFPLIKEGMFSGIALVTAITFYAYFVLMTKYYQQTLGKMVLGLRVKALKEESITWGTVLFREIVGRYLSVTTWILYVVVAFTTKKQGIHDLLADTTVIQERHSYVVQGQS